MATPSGNPWKALVAKSPFFEWIDSSLRGSGQVIYMDNPLTGLLNFVALGWGAYAEGDPAVVWGSIVATFLGTAVAYAIPGINRGNLRAGLYGFNGMLLGAGFFTFLGNTPLNWLLLCFLSVFVVFVTLTVGGVMSKFKVAGYTFPFSLTLWIAFAACWRFAHINITGLAHPTLVPHVTSLAPHAWSALDILNGSLNGVSEVYFVTNPVSGFIFLLALVVESRWNTWMTYVGALLAVLVAILMGVDSKFVIDGMMGYSPALVAGAVGCIFLKPTGKSVVYMVLAIITSVFVQAAAYSFFGTFGLPTFTFPFQLTTWLFLIGIHSLADKDVESSIG